MTVAKVAPDITSDDSEIMSDRPNLAEVVRTSVMLLVSEIQALYTMDDIPWIVGYSGGKDSTVVLQLVWTAISSLPEKDRTKPVHIISTDTLVENPVISAWVRQSLKRMENVAQQENLPFQPHQLRPSLENTYWVNLIGKGYPAPRQKFRWCTERMKIQPSNHFIRTIVRENGETILVLGTRKSESQKRASTMNKHAQSRLRDRLSPNASLPNSLIYSPIEDWDTDHVWLYLMQWQNPWGHSNKDLFQIYRGATADNECPLVVDTSTPSCGSSRFGCWVCTLVDRDKSMEAMVLNDDSKEWMQPLLDFRDELDFRSDEKREAERQHRDFRRITGNIHLFERNNREQGGKEITNVPGPYLKSWREHLLRRLLTVQHEVQQAAPADIDTIELISLDELREIRRIWLDEKHEFDDSLLQIYQDIIGQPFPDRRRDQMNSLLGTEEWQILREVCEEMEGEESGGKRGVGSGMVGDVGGEIERGGDMHFELVCKLLDVERQLQTQSRRVDIFKKLDQCFDQSSRDEGDAIANAKEERQLKQNVEAIGHSDDLKPIKQTLSEWGAMKFGKRE